MVKRIAQNLLILAVMLLVGCASLLWNKSNAIASNKEEVDSPNLGSLNTEALGDTMVSIGYKSTTPEIIRYTLYEEDIGYTKSHFNWDFDGA